MQRRLAAIGEVVLVVVAFNLVAAALLRALFPPEFLALAGDYDQADLYPGAAASAVRLIARHGLGIVLGFAVLWWRRRLTLADTGVTRNGQSLGGLIVTGVVVWAFFSIPFELIYVIHGLVPLGEGFDVFNRIDSYVGRPDFWLMWLAGAVVLPPLLEETFFRGYARTRLAEVYGPMGAVVVVTLLFMLMHGHFYSADPIKPISLVGAIVMAFGWGYATLRTGSIIPAIVAHALGNMPWPRTPGFMSLVIGVQLAILLAAYGPVREWLAACARDWRGRDREATRFGVIVTVVFLVPVMSLIAAGKRVPMLVLGIAWLVVFAVAWVLELMRERKLHRRG